MFFAQILCVSLFGTQRDVQTYISSYPPLNACSAVMKQPWDYRLLSYYRSVSKQSCVDDAPGRSRSDALWIPVQRSATTCVHTCAFLVLDFTLRVGITSQPPVGGGRARVTSRGTRNVYWGCVDVYFSFNGFDCACRYLDHNRKVQWLPGLEPQRGAVVGMYECDLGGILSCRRGRGDYVQLCTIVLSHFFEQLIY